MSGAAPPPEPREDPFGALDDPEADARVRESPAPLELAPPAPLCPPEPGSSAHARAARARIDRWDLERYEAFVEGRAPIDHPTALAETGIYHSGAYFDYPPHWLDRSVIIVREQVPRDFRRNVVVFRCAVAPQVTFEWFVGAQLHELLMKLKLATVPEVRYVAIGGHAYALASYLIRPASGGPPLRQTVAFALERDAGIVITFSALEADHDAAWAEAFEPILASFTYLGA